MTTETGKMLEMSGRELLASYKAALLANPPRLMLKDEAELLRRLDEHAAHAEVVGRLEKERDSLAKMMGRTWPQRFADGPQASVGDAVFYHFPGTGNPNCDACNPEVWSLVLVSFICPDHEKTDWGIVYKGEDANSQMWGVEPERCYSTREAAEAALKAEGEGKGNG